MPDPTTTQTPLDMAWASADRWRDWWIEENHEKHCLRKRLEDAEERHHREVSRLQRDCAELRDLVREALNHTDLPVCGECKGTGKVRDEEMVGGRTWMGVREVVVECRECDGLGRVL